jgi:hypothetical protein
MLFTPVFTVETKTSCYPFIRGTECLTMNEREDRVEIHTFLPKAMGGYWGKRPDGELNGIKPLDHSHLKLHVWKTIIPAELDCSKEGVTWIFLHLLVHERRQQHLSAWSGRPI